MFFHDFSTLDIETGCRAIGLVSFAIYVTGFFGLATGRINSQQPLYFLSVLSVLTAATCVMIGLWADFNISAALIQGFYIVMSLGAVMLRLRAWRMARV